MYNKKMLLNNLNKIIRNDKYINDLFDSLGIQIDVVEGLIQKMYENYWFDTMTEDLGIPILAKQLNIKLDDNISLDRKRAILEARWKNKGKTNIELLQSVCNSWNDGEIEASFHDGVIKIIFVGKVGIPKDLDSLKNALNNTKPAHLLIEYIFKYISVETLLKMTISEMQKQTMGAFSFN